MSITINHSNIGNPKKVINVSKPGVSQHFFCIWSSLLFKNFTDIQPINEIKKNFALAEKPRG